MIRTIIVCEVGCAPYVHDIEATPWNFVKELIGENSYVQILRLEDGVDVFSDEDGISKRLKHNRSIPAKAPVLNPGVDFISYSSNPVDMAKPGEEGLFRILGPFILTRTDPNDGESISLTEGDVEKYMKFFQENCAFCGGNKPAYPGAIYCGAGCSARAGR
jgi:hypothetical protein